MVGCGSQLEVVAELGSESGGLDVTASVQVFSGELLGDIDGITMFCDSGAILGVGVG